MTFAVSDRILLVLIALTLVTFSAPAFGLSETMLVLGVLLLAVIKAQLVVDYFMDLKRVRGFWRPLLTGYLLLVGGLIAWAFIPGGGG